MDLRSVFDCMISVSELGRGQASKVIQAIEENGNPYIVVKNNKPQAVIISVDEYIELMKAKDLLKNMPSNYLHNDYSSLQTNSLTEDEMNIFLHRGETD